MASDDESDGENQSRRPSTTSTAGSFDSSESQSTFAYDDIASRQNSTNSLPPARSSYESDGEESFLSGYHAEDEEEEWCVQGKPSDSLPL